jgi:hypothetical protein
MFRDQFKSTFLNERGTLMDDMYDGAKKLLSLIEATRKEQAKRRKDQPNKADEYEKEITKLLTKLKNIWD